MTKHVCLRSRSQLKFNKLTQEACFSVIPQILRKSTLKLHDIISLDLAVDCLNVSLYFNDLNAHLIEKKQKNNTFLNLLPQQQLFVENVKPQHCLLSAATPLTRNWSTLAAKTFFFRYIFLFLNLKVFWPRYCNYRINCHL